MVNVLCQLQVKYYILKAVIAERNLSFKIKTTHFHTRVYISFFLCFDVKNSF